MEMKEQRDIPERAAGVLLPVSSLPSPHGIGTFGSAAYRWIDFLAQAGQRYWQVLPVGPTSLGNSPYQSFSAFAGNPYFIDLDILCEEGLLERGEIDAIKWGDASGLVDYDALRGHREPLLRKAFGRMSDRHALQAFREAQAFWLEEYVLYMAVKAAHGQRSWMEWEDAARLREPVALNRFYHELNEDIQYHVFVQYQFFRQWHALRSYSNERGVEIIGDIPIYVSLDSADVWANRHLFQLDDNGLPTEVSGCPPDQFALEGQLWGNPLYDWEHMADEDYAWWASRMRASFALYDVLRIDHFRGLESYYAIPYEGASAKEGRWRPGPGMDFVRAMKRHVPYARFIAEDLGFLTDEVRRFVKESGYPGMKVLQFAFDTRETGDYNPYNYDFNNVVFTGTHDNDTVAGWAETAASRDIAHAMEYTGIHDRAELPPAMIRLAMQNAALLAMVPLQDWLGLKSEARMNIPATVGGNNWRWRMTESMLSADLAKEMRRMAVLYGRLP